MSESEGGFDPSKQTETQAVGQESKPKNLQELKAESNQPVGKSFDDILDELNNPNVNSNLETGETPAVEE